MFIHSCVVTGFTHISVSKTVMASSEDTFVLRGAVQFGFHPVHGHNIKLSENGLLAERIKSWDGGGVYAAKVLRGTTEFEVEITLILQDKVVWVIQHGSDTVQGRKQDQPQ